MAGDGRRLADVGRHVMRRVTAGPGHGLLRREDEPPMWRRALSGIGLVIAMAGVVAVVGLVLAWLATLLT